MRIPDFIFRNCNILYINMACSVGCQGLYAGFLSKFCLCPITWCSLKLLLSFEVTVNLFKDDD